MSENCNLDIKVYEREGSPIGELYKLWFNDLAERVTQAMQSDGINYKIIRRKKFNRRKSLYAERFYDKIKENNTNE